jgi:hypothetical protein
LPTGKKRAHRSDASSRPIGHRSAWSQ